jgi:DNA-binding PadR family transcriptional regulator
VKGIAAPERTRTHEPLNQFRLLLLALLASQPAHGYQLQSMFEQLTMGSWRVSSSQVYRGLARLESERLISSEVVGDSLPARRVYQLTDEGRARLTDWLSVTSNPLHHVWGELLVRVVARTVAELPIERVVMESERRACYSQLRGLTDRRNARDLSPASVLVVDALALQLQAMLGWLDLHHEYGGHHEFGDHHEYGDSG